MKVIEEWEQHRSGNISTATKPDLAIIMTRSGNTIPDLVPYLTVIYRTVTFRVQYASFQTFRVGIVDRLGSGQHDGVHRFLQRGQAIKWRRVGALYVKVQRFHSLR